MKNKHPRSAGRNKRAEEGDASLTRRDMLMSSALAGAAFIPITAIKALPQAGAAAKPALAFSPAQRRTLEAFIDRLFPHDESGPGAVEMGAAEYIDRSFVDFLAAEKESFAGGMAAVDAFAKSSQGAPLAELSPEKRDAVLTAIDTNGAPALKAFFNRARRLTIEGMFSDPYWGGNKNFAGWDLIKYPGPKLMATPDDQKMSALPKPVRKSIYAANATEQNHGH